MQPTYKIKQGMEHTSRYKPSKEILTLTRRKMDEAENILKRLNARLQTAKNNTERESILQRIEDIKRQYEGYLRDLQSQECMTTQPLPHEPPPKDTMPEIDADTFYEDGLKKTRRHQESDAFINDNGCKKTKRMTDIYEPNATKPGEPYVPKEVKIGMQLLARRTGKIGIPKNTMEQLPDTWSQCTRENVEEGNRDEAEFNKMIKAQNKIYKENLEEQMQAFDHSLQAKVGAMKIRPKSPKIYDESTFSKIGQEDIRRQKMKLQDQKNQQQMFEQEIKIHNQTKKLDRDFDRRQPGIDMEACNFPTDRFDENGKVIKSAIPPKYLAGKTFSDQEPMPEPVNKVTAHLNKQYKEHQEMQETLKLQKISDERDAAVIKARNDKIAANEALSNAVCGKTDIVKAQIKMNRVGTAYIYPDDKEITNGNYYGNINRVVHPQPNAKNDVVYAEGNFIDRIDDADRKRAAMKSQLVLPLTEEEKRQVELKAYYAKNPQAAPLDASDINTIKNYISEYQERHDRLVATKKAQEAYDAELAEELRLKRSINEDQIPEHLKKLLIPPKYIKAPF